MTPEFKPLILAIAISAIPTLSAIAQSQPGTPQPEHSNRQQVTIPAGDLTSALNTFAARFGVSLQFNAALTQGLRTQGIDGETTLKQGFAQLLSGTGLTAITKGEAVYVIQKTEGVLILPPVKVLAEVRGTKLSGTTQEIDVSVEVLDEARLERERIIDLSDVFTKTPNLTGDGIDSGRLSIRGINRAGFAGRGSTSNIYVDGSPLTENALTFGPTSLWDVQQVEVLRGSQSTVQGRNALAGAVVIETADPSFEPEAKVRLTRARFAATQAAAAVRGAIINDQLAGRFSVDQRNSDGFIKDSNGNTSSVDALTSRAKLLFRPSALSGFESKLTLEHATTESNASDTVRAGEPILSPDGVVSDFDFFDYRTPNLDSNSDITTTRIISETSYALNNHWSVRGIVTHENTEVDTFSAIDSIDEFGATFTNTTEQVNDDEAFTAEVRFEFDYERLRGLFGAYYFDSETNLDSQLTFLTRSRIPSNLQPFISLNPADSTTDINTASSGKTKNIALYSQFEWELTEHIRVNAGFRYDREEFNDPNQSLETISSPDNCIATVAGFVVQVPLPTVNLSCQDLTDLLTGAANPLGPAPDQSFSAFLPRIGVTYRFNDNHSVSLSYQEGYRAGGSTISDVDTDGDDRVDARRNLKYDPEYLDTIEFSTRNLFFDKKLVANANIFYSKYEDQQIVIVGDNPLNPFNTRVENAAETTLYGAEFLLDYFLNEQWNLYASVGLLRTEIDDLPFANQGEFENLAGNELPNAPKLTYTLGAIYESASGLYASASYSYIGEQHSSVENLDSDDFRQAFADAAAAGQDVNPEDGARFTEVLESRGDLTMTAGYRFNGLNIYAFGSNLLNDESLTFVGLATVNQQSGQIVFDQNARAIPNQLRTYGIGIDYEF